VGGGIGLGVASGGAGGAARTIAVGEGVRVSVGSNGVGVGGIKVDVGGNCVGVGVASRGLAGPTQDVISTENNAASETSLFICSSFRSNSTG
jgi:hypothetical protein